MACNDPTIDALLNRLSPSGTALFDWMRPKIDDSILRDIAYADYGLSEEEYFSALVPIRNGGKIPVPLRWCPREALELMRWSEPDVTEEKPDIVGPDGRLGTGGLMWRPQAKGERGHWIRFFSCAVLLKAADDVETQDYISAESETLIQFVASALWLGPEAIHHALRFLCWRVLRASIDEGDYPFFAMAILLLRVSLFERDQDANDLAALGNWVVAEEARSRASDMSLISSDEWLLGLTNFNQRHSVWRQSIREILQDPTKNVPEPTASVLHGIAALIAITD